MKIKVWLWLVILSSWVMMGFTSAGKGKLCGKVEMYLSQGRSDEAMALVNAIIASNPRGTDAYFSRAFLNLKLNRQRQAIEDFSQIISIQPEDPAAYLSRGLVYTQLNDFDHAAADYAYACTLGDTSGCTFAEQLNGKARK